MFRRVNPARPRADAAQSADVKHPPPWIFVLTGMPYGVVGSFAGTVMPFMTQRAGIPLDDIGTYGTILQIAAAVQFLYAPIIDLGPRRKHWLVIVAGVGAAFLLAGVAMPLPDRTTAFMVLVTASQLISGLVGACNGGLMASSLPNDQRGKAAGWYNIGNLSGGGLSAMVAVYLVGQEVSPAAIALVLVAMMIVPSLAALWIDEPERPRIHARARFGGMLRDVRGVVSARAGLTGIALCLSPVGTAALVNYFAGMSDQYHASASTVAAVTGIGNVGLTALGAGVCGYLCDRFNRRALYLVSGALTALCAIVMAHAPRTELTYAVGVNVYALVTGFCYAAFTATVLETIGKAGHAASTQYTLFTAAGNIAIAYVGFVDTRFSERHGVEGVLWSDAVLNLAGVAVLALAFWRLRSFGRWRHGPDEVDPPAAAPASPPAAT